MHPEQQVPPDELPPCPHTSTTLSTLSRLPVSDSSMPEAARRGGLSGEDPGEAAVPGPLLVWHRPSKDHRQAAPPRALTGLALTPPLSPVLLPAFVVVGGGH